VRLQSRHTTLLANLAIPIIGGLSGVLLARALGPADRGIFALLQSLPAVVATVASVGMAEALAFHVARSPDQEDRYSLLRSSTVIVIVGSLIAIGFGFALSTWLFGIIDDDYRDAFTAALLYIPALTFAFVAQGWYRGSSRLASWNFARALPGLLWAIAVCVIFVWQPTVLAMAVGMSVSGVLVLVVLAIIGRSDLRDAYRARPGSGRPLMRYGVPSTLSTLPRLINLRFDQLFLLIFLPSEAVGFYVTAVAWSSLIPAVASVRAMNRFVDVAALEPASRWPLVKDILRNGLKVSIIAGVILAALSPIVFPLLFGEAFRPARNLAAAMALVGVANAMMAITTSMLWAWGLPGRLLIADLSALAATLLILIGFSPLIGVWSAVLASFASYVTAVCLSTSFMRRDSRTATTRLEAGMSQG
jgi:O-antigen/teichoic acid export membrane protein